MAARWPCAPCVGGTTITRLPCEWPRPVKTAGAWCERHEELSTRLTQWVCRGGGGSGSFGGSPSRF